MQHPAESAAETRTLAIGRWLPLALLAIALGFDTYLLLVDVTCGGRDSRFESIAYGAPPVLLLASPLTLLVFSLSGFVRGWRPWVELSLSWLVVATLFLAAWARLFQCLS